MEKTNVKDKIFRFISVTIFLTAIIELALSQLSIKIMRLSSQELTGITYFGFIIFGLVTLFVTSRMKDVFFGRIFAVFMNFITGFSGFLSLRLLFSDEIFFRNLYRVMNRQTGEMELLPLGARITSSIPLILIGLGVIIYTTCALTILVLTITSVGKKNVENSP